MSFKNKFQDYLQTHDPSNEWFYSNFNDEIIDNLDSEGAFNLIPEVVNFLLEQSDECLCSQMLGLLTQLARKTKTTEIPKVLQEKINVIEKHLNINDDYKKSKFNELKSWYRL